MIIAQQPPVSLSGLAPWRDRRGGFSWLRAAFFALACAPALWLAGLALAGSLGARPIEAALNFTGNWTVRFLMLSLALTPLRRIFGWNGVVGVRRMVGLTVFCHAAAHLTLYAADQGWVAARVFSEIGSRVYLMIGITALTGLTLLAATSFDAAIRTLGAARWRGLHLAVHGIAALALLHVWLQVRLGDYIEPLLLSGVLAFLWGLRWIGPRRGAIGPGRVLALGAGAAALTALGEAAFLFASFKAPPLSVLAANLDVAYGPTPAVWVLGATAAVALAALLAQRAGQAVNSPA